MTTQEFIRQAQSQRMTPQVAPLDALAPVQAAEIILRRLGARAISLLTNPRTLEDGRTLPARLSANDAYVALEEACRKMARVALRKYQGEPELRGLEFAEALGVIFPDPVAYLMRSIRSVVSDTERVARREVPTVSMDTPLMGTEEGGIPLSLRDTMASDAPEAHPEETLIEREERVEFRQALAIALKSLPVNYLAALQRDMDRERERQEGTRVAAESDRERQTLCRARAALTVILKRECGLDNPFVRLLAQQRSSRVRKKTTPSPNWTAERQSDLFRRLLNTSWTDRAQTAHLDDNLDEAVINEVSVADNIAPPSPEMRQVMRVMDTYTLSTPPKAETPLGEELYAQAWKARQAGRVEEAIRLFRAAYEAEPTFFAASNEVGVLLCQMGNLRDALKVYLDIIEKAKQGDQRYIAATNAADIYLTWFDAGRNRERNIERATYYAQMAMERPTPMRACNLLLAYVKDRYFVEAQRLLETVLRTNLPSCPADKLLQTLAQIRDADLITWWNWLDGELGKESESK